MTTPQQDRRRSTLRSAFIWLGFLLVLTYLCQWLIFRPDWSKIAVSVLIGTCMTLVGAFAALLASPHGAEDEKRLSKVSTTIGTLLTGYVVAKIFDPLLEQMIPNSSALLDDRRGANFLIGMIGFLCGFLGTYVIRAYVTGTDEGGGSTVNSAAAAPPAGPEIAPVNVTVITPPPADDRPVAGG